MSALVNPDDLSIITNLHRQARELADTAVDTLVYGDEVQPHRSKRRARMRNAIASRRRSSWLRKFPMHPLPECDESTDDERTRTGILDELDFAEDVDARGILVRVTDGIASLIGHVHSYSEKCAAESAAWRVKGVRALVPSLVINPVMDTRSDESLALRALELLSAKNIKGAIRLTVQNGWLTLEGNADWSHERTRAEKALRDLPGVSGVTDRLALKTVAQSIEVHHCIEQALRRGAELDARRILVQANDKGAVTLEGNVDSWSRRYEIHQAALAAPGVQTVDDRINVVRNG